MSIYSVNGKEPVAAWIESLDPELVTSSKATDLVGTNHGTLTSMDLTADPDTARRADTDAGGRRALVYDGTNDYVSFGTPAILGTTPISVSFWVKTTWSTRAGLITRQDSGGTGWIIDMLAGGAIRVYAARSTTTSQYRQLDTIETINDGQWHHVVAVIADTSAIYIDGTEATYTGVMSAGTIPTLKTSIVLAAGSNVPFSFFLNGRMDGIRAFDVTLDADDRAWLFDGGNGRSRVDVSGESRRRRQSVSGGVL